MFTSVDKALVALIMGVLYILNTFAGIDLGVDAQTVSVIIGALTPVLVYFVPNKNTVYVTDTQKAQLDRTGSL